MSTLSLILLLGLMAPQDQPGGLLQDKAERALQHTLILPQRVLPRQDFSNATCYTVRSYRFRRQDGNAPVLIGTSTCTPANTVRSEQVANPPKARLVPQ